MADKPLTLRFCRAADCAYRSDEGFASYKCDAYRHATETVEYVPAERLAEAELYAEKMCRSSITLERIAGYDLLQILKGD